MKVVYCWYLFLLMVLVLPARAEAQAVVSLAPQPGEIRLTGTVTRVLPERRQFVLLAQQVTVAESEARNLPTPKPKTIMISASTTFSVLSTGENRLPYADKTDFSTLAIGMVAIVVGRIGKAGDVVGARLVCIPPRYFPALAPEPIREPSDPPGKNLLQPTDRLKSWTLASHEPAQASVEEEDGAIKVSVETAGKEDWRVQLSQTGVAPENGVSYTLSFRARADMPRPMRVSAQVLESDFHDIGINRTAQIGREWAGYEYTFVARNLGPKGHLLPVFFFGTEKGTTWLADVTLAPSYPETRGHLLEAISNPGAWKLVPSSKEGSATLRINGQALEIGTTAIAKAPRAVGYQLMPASPVLVIPGRNYILTFRGQSSAERNLRLRGVLEPIKLEPQERDFTIRFSVKQQADFGACPNFLIGDQLGTFTLRDLVLREDLNPNKEIVKPTP